MDCAHLTVADHEAAALSVDDRHDATLRTVDHDAASLAVAFAASASLSVRPSNC